MRWLLCVLFAAFESTHALSGWISRVHRVGTFEIEVQERSQSDPEHLGGLTWTGGRALAEYLTSQPLCVEGKRVLELGCGSALVSHAAAKLGAASVAATDVDGLDRVDAALAPSYFDSCSDEPLPDCDLLLAADVMYTTDLALALARRASEAHRSGATVIVADSQGWASSTFREALDVELGATHSFQISTLVDGTRRKRVRILHLDPP